MILSLVFTEAYILYLVHWIHGLDSRTGFMSMCGQEEQTNYNEDGNKHPSTTELMQKCEL